MKNSLLSALRTISLRGKMVCICVAALGVGLVIGVVVQIRFSGAGAIVVTQRVDGFFPPTLVIATGDTVVFKSKREFWPASDPHPTHTLLSGFDAKKPVRGSWSYTFGQGGVWTYHDHLRPRAYGKNCCYWFAETVRRVCGTVRFWG